MNTPCSVRAIFMARLLPWFGTAADPAAGGSSRAAEAVVLPVAAFIAGARILLQGDSISGPWERTARAFRGKRL